MSSTALFPLLRVPPPQRTTLPRLFFLFQTRGARLLQRPKRPHLLDQIVILSDGSSFKQVTTSPRGVLRTSKDVRNHPLWNASDALLAGVEEDEAGKLKAFRMRYGRGFDIELEEGVQEEDDNLMDLYSSWTEAPKVEVAAVMAEGAMAEPPRAVAEKGKKKGKK